MRFILFVLLLGALSISAQQPAPDKTYKLFFEKAYLHTDREQYTDGEDIWFKAYLVNGQNNYLFDASNNMYVELIGTDSKIIDRKVIRLDNGTGYGDFHLNDSIPAGNYRIRAYTNWMRNFGDNFIFEKGLQVFSKPAKIKSDLIADSKYKSVNRRYARKNPEGTAYIDTAYHLYFFPEGGAMLEDVAGKVGFKAVDPWGNGIAVKGKIYDSERMEVSAFECDSTGLGAFELKPLPWQSYTARGMFDGNIEINEHLSPALEKGLSLSTALEDTVLRLSIIMNLKSIVDFKGSLSTLAIKSKGKLCYIGNILLSSLENKANIPLRSLPPGLLAITLYDDTNRPHCERLVYHEPEELSKATISTDEHVYSAGGKVTALIKTTGAYNQPVKANLSVSVTDASLVIPNRTDIVSYLDLKSEIRGRIDNEHKYFDLANPNRKKQLDLLLLTQGWRDFTWRRLQDSAIRISYMLEKGMTISGRVRRIWVNKPIEQTNITLQAFKARGEKLFATLTDTAGKFYFDNVNLYGKQFLKMYSMKNAKRGGGELEDFPVFEAPVKVKILRSDSSAVTWGTLSTDSLLSLRKDELKKWRLSDTIQLKEVAVNGKRNFSNKIPPPPQHFLINDKFRTNYKYLYHFLLAECKDCLINNAGDGIKTNIIPKGNTTRPSSYDDVKFVSMEKVENLFITHRYTIDGQQTTVTAYVRADAFENNLNVTYFYVDGYYEARTFYSPKYKTPSTKPDLRTTIHWEPNITTNEKGEATITYYNADPKTKVRIVAEGVTADGKPVAAATTYEVK